MGRRSQLQMQDLVEEDSNWISQFWQPCILTEYNMRRLEPYFKLGFIKTGYSFRHKIATARIHKKYLPVIGVDLRALNKEPDPILIIIDEQGTKVICHLSEYINRLFKEGKEYERTVKVYATYTGLRERLLN